MGLHGGKDLRPVRHDAKHVGHVAALGKDLVVEGGDFGGHLAAVEPGNPGHEPSFCFHYGTGRAVDRAHAGMGTPAVTVAKQRAFDALGALCYLSIGQLKRHHSSVAQWQSIRLLTEGL